MTASNAVRRMLGQSLIDPVACDRGLKCLRNYRKEWDEDRAHLSRPAIPQLGLATARRVPHLRARVRRAGDGAAAAAVSAEAGSRRIVESAEGKDAAMIHHATCDICL